ncbi:glycoside hydrolase [Westerdykella ornata]|uniref:mannan endo-1,4-beta-mannosidase n=1 Tax=Westerdykella ornata TaxID=318751 RepID=A0A6A6J9C3_WESOR|nr:glycoside hydrolase [Westerdykella ornata]KAF2272794.1 glycoside hydrolase [Westerdykella ornata]
MVNGYQVPDAVSELHQTRHCSLPHLYGRICLELANEPRCKRCKTSALTDWIRKTSNYIRSLHSDHMITVGDRDSDSQAMEAIPTSLAAANFALPNISFGTFHLCPDSWGVSDSFGDGWVAAHAKICQQLSKPCLFEEYGVTKAADHCPVESGWQQTSLGLKDVGMAGDLFWQLRDTIRSTGQQTHNDGHMIYYGSSDWKCLVDEHIKRIG